MFKLKSIISMFGFLAALCFCLACGGSSDATSNGATKSKTISGVVTGFGSIYVNGVEYETEDSKFRNDDDDEITKNDISIGQVVEIVGSVNGDGITGNAVSVKLQTSIEGVIESIDVIANTITALGQVITINELTVFENASLATLQLGDKVEVHGFLGEEGLLIATKIELENSSEGSDDLKLRGVVGSLDIEAETFLIGPQLIDYSGAILKNLPQDGLSDGLLVKVKSDTALVGSVLLAVEVKFKKHEADEELELKGYVTSFESLSDFSVDGVKVLVDDDTKFENGSSDSIVLNVKLKVEGKVNGDGVLVAKELKFDHENVIMIRAKIDSINVDDNTITLLGITVFLNNSTQFEDGGEEEHEVSSESENPEEIETELEDDEEESVEAVKVIDERSFTVADMVVGQIVEIKGYVENDLVIASRLEKESFEDLEAIELKGPVVLTDSGFTILGVSIDTNTETKLKDFDGFEENDLSALAELVADQIVEISGVVSGDIIIALEIDNESEFEEHNEEQDEDDEEAEVVE